MTYEQAVEYIHGLGRFGSQLGLDRVAAALAQLGNPEQNLRVVHVAGTNGKGSTSAMIASILRVGGLRTGLYTSPYLDSFTNRFGLDGDDITGEELAAMVARLRPVAESVGLTQFEFITTLAFTYYAEREVEALVLEVGLGGRYDATNVVIPEISVITNIGFDHMEVLGDTLGKIAFEKAGIIKSGVPVVTAVEGDEPLAVITSVAAKNNAPFRLMGRDFGFVAGESTLSGQTFNYWGWQELSDLTISLLGRHQLKNAAVAIEVALLLQKRGWAISPEHIAQGLRAATWAGRFEVMSKEPLLIMDGAHNTHGVAALVKTLDEYLPGQRVLLVTGIMKDKCPQQMLKMLSGKILRVYACAPDIPRATPREELVEAARQLNLPALSFVTVREALAQAMSDARRTGGVVLVAGSLYTVSEARKGLLTK